MKSTTFALSSLLATTAIAQPFRHQHHHHHHKRQEVDCVTEWDYVTETINVTTTIWVSSGFIAPTSTAEAATTTAVPKTPAQFFQGASPPPSSTSSSTSTSVDLAPTPSTSSNHVAPVPSSAEVAPAPAPALPPPENPAAVDVVQVKSSSTPSSVSVPGTTSAAPVYLVPPTVAAAVTTTAPTPSTSSSSSSGGASSGCTSDTPCTGDITYYDAGMGACGWTNDGSSEHVVALPHELMGTQSNGNPYCGQMITVKCSVTGKTTTAKVVDKCGGCKGNSIDLSNAAFLDLNDLSVGRSTAEWWFN